ncbi:hypothetical protein ACFYYN_39240 [Streptomyces sp. NPDC001902]
MVVVLLRHQQVEVDVDFYGFCLQEAADQFVPEMYPDGRESIGEPFLTARPGRLDIESGGHTHTAHLRAEVFDAEPPADTREPWEASGQAPLFSQSGELRIWGVAGGPMEESLELGATDTQWQVRVYCSGRAEVGRLAQLEVPKGVERYLVQFWPAA